MFDFEREPGAIKCPRVALEFMDIVFTYLYTVTYSRPQFLAIIGRRRFPFIRGAAFRGEPRGATLQLQGRTECSEDLWCERAASGRRVKEVEPHALTKCAGMDVQVGSCLVQVWFGARLQLNRGFAVLEQLIHEARAAEPLALAANDNIRHDEPAPRWWYSNLVAFVQAEPEAAGVRVTWQRDAPPPHQALLLEAQPTLERALRKWAC